MQAFLRRLSTITLAVVALTGTALAQATEDDYDFSEIPVEEEEIPYIGVGGGYQLQMIFFNRDEINALAARMGVKEFSGALFTHGGGGWTAIGIIPNLRVGVFGGGGSMEEAVDVDTLGGYRRSLQLTSGFTGALIDYAITPFSKFTIAPGVLVGGGSTTVEFTQTRDGATYNTLFDRASLGGGGAELNRQASMTRSYFHIMPQLNLEYALTQFILLRVGGGYTLNTGGSWTDRHGTEIGEVPDGLNTQGLTLQAGLFLGLFQQ